MITKHSRRVGGTLLVHVANAETLKCHVQLRRGCDAAFAQPVQLTLGYAMLRYHTTVMWDHGSIALELISDSWV